jgi:tetratricopeptide (TPR) repeat protein
MKTEEFEKSLEDLLLAKKYDPENARIFLYLGQLYFKLDQLDAATGAIFEALDLRAGYSDALSLLSEIYVKQEKYADAVDALTQAVENTRYRRERFYVKRANVYLQTGDIRKALADFVLAREDNPENAAAWLGEFEAALAVDDRDVARAALDEFTKLRPNDKRIASLRDRLE